MSEFTQILTFLSIRIIKIFGVYKNACTSFPLLSHVFDKAIISREVKNIDNFHFVAPASAVA